MSLLQKHFKKMPTILYRRDYQIDFEEINAAKKYFNVVENRCKCHDTVVIGRYSVLPFYRELEIDMKDHDCVLINSFNQHLWIANFDYYEVLKKYTFESWDEKKFPYANYDGPMVVKGRTNSKKHSWNTMMFANNRREAIEVASRLYQDNLVGTQGLIYRRYVPLVTYEIGLNGLPFTNEWRCFFWGEKLIAHGYYWTEAEDVETPRLSEEGMRFALKIAKIAAKYVNFFVLDIGEKAEGGWILIEVNDGQQSGLSMIDPYMFYGNLASIIESEGMNADLISSTGD